MSGLILHIDTINRAKEVGFDLCGVVRACNVESQRTKVEEWIANGYNSQMNWFERNREQRYNPQLLTDSLVVKSLVICGISYQLPSLNPLSPIASYAHFRDYHITIKQMLASLHQMIESDNNKEISARYFVDSAPILERYWAKQAGFGWIGKNSMLINRQFGSMFFIGSILLEGEFNRYNSADDFDGCAGCNRCIEACPNGAINSNHTINTNRCISYLTIEHRAPYTDNQQEMINRGGAKVFGCDSCLSICPWNIRSAKMITPEIENRRKELLDYRQMPTTPSELLTYKIPKDSPLKRAGRSKIDMLVKNKGIISKI